jgi:hypothetical protein
MPRFPAIAAEERDSTQDWVVPRGSVPLVSELEARIDEAVVIARASEEGVREVGEMALDAARQARRAAEAAEKSAKVAVEARDEVGSAAPESAGTEVVGRDVVAVRQPRFEIRFRSFNERADRLSARLRALQEHRSHPAGSSVGAGRRRGDG